jgi:hypothetical protein
MSLSSSHRHRGWRRTIRRAIVEHSPERGDAASCQREDGPMVSHAANRTTGYSTSQIGKQLLDGDFVPVLGVQMIQIIIVDAHELNELVKSCAKRVLHRRKLIRIPPS